MMNMESDETRNYNNTPPKQIPADDDILMWWNEYRFAFPSPAAMARDHLSINETSVLSDCLLS